VPPADTQHYPLEADKVTSHNTSNLGGPILCRDQLEEFSASESTLFEDGIEKYGKDFNDIRLDYVRKGKTNLNSEFYVVFSCRGNQCGIL
jgi:metastasis-associated protein MTA